MSQIQLVLPDGSKKSLPKASTGFDLALSIGAGLAKAALGLKVNGEVCDLCRELHDGDAVEILTKKSPEALAIMRHSLTHILAEAVSELFDDVNLGTGPATDTGFYYDFALPAQISSEDFEAIEARMREIIKRDEPFERAVVSREEAAELLSGQRLKQEVLANLEPGTTLTIYRHGAHTELCRGPQLPRAGFINPKAFCLDKVAGAYWRGDAKNEQLQRVYGIAFFDKKELDDFIYRREEAKKRDHRVLGPKLGIYETIEQVGPGLPLFLPNGASIVRTLQRWLRSQLLERGYEEVITPHVYKADVWKTSGHYDFYHENMYFFKVNEGSEEEPRYQEFGVKPMNCPGHVLLYKSNLHSYREMPLRYFEFGTVYRHELSGAVHGLFRARGFTQDDAHLFCREDQVVSEVKDIIDLIDHIMNTFNLRYSAEISTRPEHSIGTDEMWNKAESFLKQALDEKGLNYEINEGDGAFYGPKIDFKITDSIGRTWQCSTVQVDFNLPERFKTTYRSAENTELRPWMLHRAIFGSIERFLGILIEHYAGSLPLWLAPVQVQIVPIADRHLDYAHEIARSLKAVAARVQVSEQSEPMKAKIAKAQDQKIPYMLIVGDKELENKTLSVRERHQGNIGQQSLEEFIEFIKKAQV